MSTLRNINRYQTVSRFGLAVRRQAGKQRDLGSNPLRLSFLFKSCGLWTLSLFVCLFVFVLLFCLVSVVTHSDPLCKLYLSFATPLLSLQIIARPSERSTPVTHVTPNASSSLNQNGSLTCEVSGRPYCSSRAITQAGNGSATVRSATDFTGDCQR